MKKSWGVQSHKNTEERSRWETPWELFKCIEQHMGIMFVLDAAASKENRKCLLHYGDGTCGIASPWLSWTWCNPPYTRTADFVKKAIEEKKNGTASIIMTYAACDVAWFHSAFEHITEIIFIKGRVRSIDPKTGKISKNSPAKGHMIMVFDPFTESDRVVCSTLDYKGKK